MATWREGFGVAMGKGVRAATRTATTCSLFLLVSALTVAAETCDVQQADLLR